LRGANHSIVQAVAGLRYHHYRTRRVFGSGLLHQRLVQVWVELLVQGLDRLALVLTQGRGELLGHELHALEQASCVGIFLRRLDSPADVVHHRQQVAHQRQGGILGTLL